MEKSLLEVPSEDWMELCQLYRKNWPEHLFAYGIVSNYIRWMQSALGNEISVKILSLNGTWRENGTFVLFDDFEIYFYSFDADTNYSTLTDALCLVPWEIYSEVSTDFLERHRLAFNKAVSYRKLTIAKDSAANFYYMSRIEVARLEFHNPPSFHLKRISIDNLDYIYNRWALRESISRSAGYNLLKRLILLNESIGLYNENGTLVSWCLRDQTGAFADLQTCEHHLRKGYGRVVVASLARCLAEQGDESYAFVLSDNYKSCRLFEQLGFRNIEGLCWVVIRPKNDDTVNP
ncbi:glycine-N-acyltransferase-like protein 3 [Wyeomyia smithii]|uniref:glycine-N-acyltransferase-like protein 3 n=1 Tax=Wyeomyia smithii TaxID=174621 RepID=UPI0024681CF0|nr:glycine-N-acyltransferase-like protein 3 [Wyeomyia smithii]